MLGDEIFPELSLELRRVRRGLPVVCHILYDGHERVAADGGDGLRLSRHIQQHAKPLPHAAQGKQIRVLPTSDDCLDNGNSLCRLHPSVQAHIDI